MLLHTSIYNSGGIGDFLRSCFIYFIFCKKNDIYFDIYIPHDQPLSCCFKPLELKIIEQLKDNIYFEDLKGVANINTINFLKQILRNKDKNYIIRSNVCNIYTQNDILKYRKDFIDFLFSKFSQKLINSFNFELNNITGKYISIHVRYGDKYIKDNCNQPVIVFGKPHKVPNKDNFDVRIEELEVIKSLMKIKKKDLMDDCLIYLFTDNQNLKNIIQDNLINLEYNLQITNLIPYHTAYSTYEKGIIDSFVEFLIMGNSEYIISLNKKDKLSGFSLISALIFGKKILLLENNEDLFTTYQDIDIIKLISNQQIDMQFI